jgi:hypothetical protein
LEIFWNMAVVIGLFWQQPHDIMDIDGVAVDRL